MTKQNTVVVGAGYAGISATKFLAEKLEKDADVTITLTGRRSYHTVMIELHKVAGGRVGPEAIQYDLQRLSSHKRNVKLVTDTVTGINKESKVARALAGSYPFDQLILGMGGESNDLGTPGVKKNGFALWPFDDAVKIRHHVEATVAKTAVEPDTEIRRAMSTFVVCGSDLTGVEMVGELIDWKGRLTKDTKIDPDEITLMVVEAMPTILNMLSRSNAAKAERYLEKKNVQLLLGSPIAETTTDHIKLEDSSEVPAHMLIWITGAKATSDAADFGLEATRGSRLVANEYMQAKGYEDKNIYVIGDLVYYEETPNTPTPQIVRATEQAGHATVANVVADVKGGERHAFKGNCQGFMVSIGAKWGVTNLFNKIHLSGFLAITMKHIINLKYFSDIRFGYYMFQYIMYKIFHIKDDHSVTRGHASRCGNVLWNIPLRVFYGMVWLVESMKKIVGNGDYLKPSVWFGNGSWFVDKVVFPLPWLRGQVTTGASQATETATTATSGATDAAADGGADAATQTAHFGLSYAYGETPMQVFDHMPRWFESIAKFMMPNQEVALFMQKFMTIVEVCIALTLIAGLFIWLSGAATIDLTIIFCLSGVFYWVNIWFIPVAFALMNGSGRAVGLDRWVVPWIQRKLGRAWYGIPGARYGGK